MECGCCSLGVEWVDSFRDAKLCSSCDDKHVLARRVMSLEKFAAAVVYGANFLSLAWSYGDRIHFLLR